MDIILILIIIAIPALAQLSISINYKIYKNEKNTNNLSGAEIARKILDNNGLNNVTVKCVSGNLSDYYDPRLKEVCLSQDVYSGKSIASTAIAAHQCGHAVQDKEEYFFLRIRAAIYPVVKIANDLAYWIILLGFITGFLKLFYLGIILTALGLVFQVVTLPVEFNASSRAIDMIMNYNLISSDEKKGTKKVLGSAAMTYVAGTIATILQILRLLLLARSRD